MFNGVAERFNVTRFLPSTEVASASLSCSSSIEVAASDLVVISIDFVCSTTVKIPTMTVGFNLCDGTHRCTDGTFTFCVSSEIVRSNPVPWVAPSFAYLPAITACNNRLLAASAAAAGLPNPTSGPLNNPRMVSLKRLKAQMLAMSEFPKSPKKSGPKVGFRSKF